MTLVMVLAGGALGALCRFLVDRAVTLRRRGVLPWGTLIVNVVGSLLLGLLAGAGVRSGTSPGGAVPNWLGALLGTGFCGALTTDSTFAYETVRLATAPAGTAPAGTGPAPAASAPGGPALAGPATGGRAALLNVALTLAAGLGAAGLGWWLATLG
jgi:CrcB protein